MDHTSLIVAIVVVLLLAIAGVYWYSTRDSCTSQADCTGDDICSIAKGKTTGTCTVPSNAVKTALNGSSTPGSSTGGSSTTLGASTTPPALTGCAATGTCLPRFTIGSGGTGTSTTDDCGAVGSAAWYDVNKQGAFNDLCRTVGGDSPTFSCAIAGSTTQYSPIAYSSSLPHVLPLPGTTCYQGPYSAAISALATGF